MCAMARSVSASRSRSSACLNSRNASVSNMSLPPREKLLATRLRLPAGEILLAGGAVLGQLVRRATGKRERRKKSWSAFPAHDFLAGGDAAAWYRTVWRWNTCSSGQFQHSPLVCIREAEPRAQDEVARRRRTNASKGREKWSAASPSSALH